MGIQLLHEHSWQRTQCKGPEVAEERGATLGRVEA